MGKVSFKIGAFLPAEVIDQLGNPSKQRRENLLDACIELLKQTETLVPAVYHFLMEFLVKWDKFSHMSKVHQLIRVRRITMRSLPAQGNELW